MIPAVLRAYGIYDPRSRLLRKASPATTSVPPHLRTLFYRSAWLGLGRPCLDLSSMRALFSHVLPRLFPPACRADGILSRVATLDLDIPFAIASRPTYIRVYLPIISRRILSTDEMYPHVRPVLSSPLFL